MPKQYDKYKNSGIAWIGEIPQHWNIHKLNNILTSVGSGTTPKGNDAYYGGKIPWLNTGDLTDSYIYNIGKTITELALKEYSTLKIYTPNSVVIAMYGATIGKLGILTREATTNQACCVISCKDKLISKYLFYVLYASREYILTLSYGAGQPNISQETIKTFRICLPNLLEQQQIADYLDKKCAEIDRIVETQKNIIEKLKEYKQAIITETVTKGLVPNIEMKDSGLTWCNHIPTHWENKKMISILSMRVIDGPHESPELYDDGIPYISATAIENGKINFSLMRGYISSDYCDICDTRYKPQLYDILVVKLGASTGKVAIVETDKRFNIWVPLAAVRCNEKVNPYFIYYAFQSNYFIKQMEMSWTYGTQQTLGVKTIEQLRVLVPSINEQQQIVDYLDKKCSEIDTAISEKEQLIEKLTEYKKSLIYECVTGKKKV